MKFYIILKRSAARVLVAGTLLTCAMLAGGGSIAHATHGGWAMDPSPRYIVNPPPRTIDASCTQAWQDPSGQWHEFPNGEMTLTQGTPLQLHFEFTTQNGARATFTAATNTNIFL